MAAARRGPTGQNVKKNSYKTLNGETIRPCMYVGKQIGHGNYMAGVCNGKLIRDKDGRPLVYKQIVST